MKQLSFVFLAAGLAACGGGSAPVVPAPPQAQSALGVHHSLVYVSDHTNSLIDVFDLQGRLRYTLTGGVNKPAGLFVDASHNLWVANPGANDVLVFPRGSKMPSETLSDTNAPNDVTVCHDGTAFVADSLNLGGVAVYPPGHTNPTRRLIARQSNAGGIEFYVTCDDAGNIFATGLIGLSPFAATVAWRRARESGYYLLQPTATSESGLKATAARTLLITTYDAPSQPALEEFNEAGKSLGRGIHTGGSDLWGDIALNARQNVVFGVDTPQDMIVARKWPGGELVRTYTNANLKQPEGVAIDPGD